MSVRALWPLLTATHRYDKSFSTWGRGAGVLIEAPILAYLIETRSGRLLVDVGCDYQKLSEPALVQRWFERRENPLPRPTMSAEQRIPRYLAQLGLSARDIDAVILTHLHFDHAGGLGDFRHADVHVHERELRAAREPADQVYFADEVLLDVPVLRLHASDYQPCPGVTVTETFGHTAGHMSVLLELERGQPVLLAGDAADLRENLQDEVAPGLCHRNDPAAALASIRKLKGLAREARAQLWPNHDLEFFRAQPQFPASYPR
jgi:N-acyl homoserine lactone hydrolase